MIVRPTRHHTQIEIDVRLTRDEYSVNALITIASLLIHRGFKKRDFYSKVVK